MFEKIFSVLYSAACWQTFFVEFDFLHVECLKLFVSKSLGYGIIVGSSLVKFPQILKILLASNAAGISFSSVFMELLAISFGVAYGYGYGYPFSAYGEGVFMAVQTFLIAFFVLWYDGYAARSLLFFTLYCSMMIYLCSSLVPLALVTALQASNLPFVLGAKGLQAYINFQNKSTGQLSAVTLILLLAGSVARIFTSMHETGDSLVVWTYIVATVMNAILVYQTCYLYRPSSVKEKSKKLE